VLRAGAAATQVRPWVRDRRGSLPPGARPVMGRIRRRLRSRRGAADLTLAAPEMVPVDGSREGLWGLEQKPGAA